jgi:heptaprenyl diphosphate synthase
MASTPSSADRRSSTRALVTAGLLVALGAVLGLVENAIVPPLPVPGVRLGLANIAVVIALALLGPRKALEVSVLRIVIVGIATGSLGGYAGLMAASGAIASWGVMASMSRRGATFSVVGWSVAGAAAHILGQLLAASAIVGSTAPLLLAPISLTLAIGCGLTIGYSTRLLLSRLPLVRSLEAVG